VSATSWSGDVRNAENEGVTACKKTALIVYASLLTRRNILCSQGVTTHTQRWRARAGDPSAGRLCFPLSTKQKGNAIGQTWQWRSKKMEQE